MCEKLFIAIYEPQFMADFAVIEVDSHPGKTPEGSRIFSLISAVVKI
jgi:hypothetical protein